MADKKCIRIFLVGCGQRGECYSSYALIHPDRAKIVGMADPRSNSRSKIAKLHEATVEKELIFNDWRKLNELDKVADCVIIALPDKLHKEAAIALSSKGYHILLEKPMATELEDCKQITMACRQSPEIINAVCHVLRYYAPCLKLKQLIDSGLIGNVININHIEPVGYYHFAHSFVRGNWHKESDSSFSLLAKCCHDIDLIVHWMNKKCVSVSSHGSLTHFKAENAPPNSTTHCFDCPSEPECCFSAKKIYNLRGPSSWPASVLLSSEIGNIVTTDIEDFLIDKTDEEKAELIEKCLRHEKTNYGRCVYKMDNDVVDNQVVTIEFDDGSLATLTMIAFTKDLCQRKTKIYGTKGELEWDDSKSPYEINHFDFITRKETIINCVDAMPESLVATSCDLSDLSNKFFKMSGHGGADYWLMHSFINALLNNDKCLVLTNVDDSLKSHVIVFAAEESRKSGKIINIHDYCKSKEIPFALNMQ